MSIYETRYQLFGPVTAGAYHAFVPVRPRAARPAAGYVATVDDAADETVTSEGRCPR
jgi:hypothetical protein